ncbi:alpha/beta hydrolase fold domain-containing protein [Flavobacterium quisquiliarum]|uniref:Alpha/beta hydrolase fold domain-containing protein n=1 Tax=Flavobacterium quisquiliarum TaxID=1834436 RepID=A0ABV8W6T6_9FLAO|nr:alpha/beta hydrolase fold domain-containing protein [Flavobacterium quisquiliarum]MBW1655572.1 alpha/beta hydrolase fold domain-containing protein [Flavobacterium quisquiliarum]NWL03196.1 beta-galactosidase [Flavobacterium collinsii]
MKKSINIQKLKATTFLASLLISFATSAQKKEIPLWDKIPDEIQSKEYIEKVDYNKDGIAEGVRKVTIPTLTPYFADPEKSNGSAVIICPGGAYGMLAINKEGFKVAEWLNSIGIHAFVLKYRLPNDLIMKNKTVAPLQDAQEAMRMVRRNSIKWKINPNKIGIMGFSAGGHLASTLSTHYNDKVYIPSDTISAKPNFSILIYPVISTQEGITHQGSKDNLLGKNPDSALVDFYSNEKQVNAGTPKAFLVQATDDKAVPVENSINYYLALKKEKVSAEMHLYENGGHGFGLGVKGTNTLWPKTCEKWLTLNNYTLKSDAYVFTYFKGNGEDGLHLAYSEDGYKWNTLKNDTSFLTPEVGKDKLMRDPCVIKGGDGLYHMVWTVSWTDKGIGYASSKDLIHWSKQEFIPVMMHEEKTRNTWAPEITYDEKSKDYMIYWASTIDGKFPETKSEEEKGYNHRIYYTTTKDFKKFSKTKLLYDPGFNVIDASIVKQDGQYVMYLKDETRNPVQKNLKVAYSKNLTGPYSKASEPITGKYWAEGPTAVKIDNSWIVYFDKYTEKKYGAVKETAKGWEDISEQISFPVGTRHGSVIKVSSEELNNLKKEATNN